LQRTGQIKTRVQHSIAVVLGHNAHVLVVHRPSK
jgi:hypothetical protein